MSHKAAINFPLQCEPSQRSSSFAVGSRRSICSRIYRSWTSSSFQALLVCHRLNSSSGAFNHHARPLVFSLRCSSSYSSKQLLLSLAYDGSSSSGASQARVAFLFFFAAFRPQPDGELFSSINGWIFANESNSYYGTVLE